MSKKRYENGRQRINLLALTQHEKSGTKINELFCSDAPEKKRIRRMNQLDEYLKANTEFRIIATITTTATATITTKMIKNEMNEVLKIKEDQFFISNS